MPNWCEGYLKIRGKKKDLINFIENELIEKEYVSDVKIIENYRSAQTKESYLVDGGTWGRITQYIIQRLFM